MKFYVANPTRQHHLFTFRMPEEKGVRSQPIAPGQQVQIVGDLNQLQIDAIVAHYARYGLAPVSDVGSQRQNQIRLIYSVDRPVPASKIEDVMRSNMGILIREGQKMREQAAVVIPPEIERQLEGVAQLRGLEMSIVEEEPKGGYREVEEGVKPVAEGYRMGTPTMERSDDAKVTKGRARGRR
jgi:hypothetical protein